MFRITVRQTTDRRRGYVVMAMVVFLILMVLFSYVMTVWKGDPVDPEMSLSGWREQREKPILFVHFTKSAGTTMCHFAKNNGERILQPVSSDVHFSCNFYRDGPSVNKYPHTYPARFVSCQDRVAYIKQHNVTFNAIEHFLEGTTDSDLICEHDLRYVTILRQPIDRIQSWLTYLRIPPREMMNWFGEKHDDPTTFSSSSQGHFLYPYVDNYLIRTLCGPQVFRLPLGGITEEHLSRAYQLLKRFEKVMLFERLEYELVTFIQEVGWDAKMKPIHANPSTPSEMYTMTPTQRQVLQSFNRLDVRLYEMFF